MRIKLVILLLAMALASQAGVIRFSARHAAKGAKVAAHATAVVAKKAAKVAY